MEIIERIIPGQHEGWKTTTEEKVVKDSIQDACNLYQVARKRLLDVNHWHDLHSAMPAKFCLIDKDGKESEQIENESYFRIETGGPGIESGNGYDWVRVERVGEIKDFSEETELTYIIVHPSPMPGENDQHSAAHFFTSEASSCFVVSRDKLEIVAAVYGRNEKPNIHTDTILDNARNALVAVGSFLGFAKIQWKTLVTGLLDK